MFGVFAFRHNSHTQEVLSSGILEGFLSSFGGGTRLDGPGDCIVPPRRVNYLVQKRDWWPDFPHWKPIPAHHS